MRKKSKRSYRKRYLSLSRRYEQLAQREFRRHFYNWGKSLELSGPRGFWRQQIENQLTLEDLIKVYVRVYQKIGLEHGRRILRDLDEFTKNLNLSQFETDINNAVTRYISRHGLKRVVSMRRHFIDTIVAQISSEENIALPDEEFRRIILDVVGRRRFFRWQADRIARTEATAAASYGAVRAGESFGFIVDKEWVSSNDPRTRRTPPDRYDHLEMDGVRVREGEKFVFDNGRDELEFPGDPKGDAGNIINCRCTVAMVPARDKDGNLIRR